jgi:hypothetical protein
MTAPRSLQRGQSMAEFLLALAALLPLFLGISYLGRYGDLNQTATQASRYAAMQKAMHPGLSDDLIQDQMRARFFLHGSYLNHGKLRSDDSVKAIQNAKGQTSLWLDLSGKALLEKPEDVRLVFSDVAMGSKGPLAEAKAMAWSAGKSYPSGSVARVEVALVNRLPLAETTRAERFTLAAATAAGGNALGSSGSKATRDAAAVIVPLTHMPGMLSDFVEKAVSLFEPEGPVLGCIKPDPIYASRLEGTGTAGPCVK